MTLPGDAAGPPRSRPDVVPEPSDSTPSPRGSRRRLVAAALLLAPAVLAVALRAPVLDWALPDLLYQDEAYLVDIAARMHHEGSSLPRWRPNAAPEYTPFYEYGHLGLYAIRPAASAAHREAVSAGASYATDPVAPWRVAAGARRILMVFGAAMLVVVALLGFRLLSLWEGAAAAAALAVSTDHFRYSIWAKPDLVAGLLAALALLAAVVAAGRRRPALALVAALFAGAGTAAKYNAGVVAFAAVIAAAIAARRPWPRIAWGASAALAALGGFIAGMPHAAGRAGEFVAYLRRRFVGGGQLADFGPVPSEGLLGPLTVPAEAVADLFVNQHPAGWIFVALCAAGLVRLARRRRPEDVVVLVAGLLGIAASYQWLRRGFHHQLLPLAPAIALVAAAGIGAVLGWVRGAVASRPARLGATAAVGCLIALGFAGGLHRIAGERASLTADFHRDHAAWIAEHIPFGTKIGVEAGVGPMPQPAYEVYRAYSLGANPVSFYERERYAYLLVHPRIRDFISFRPEIYQFYRDLPGRAALVARLPTERTPFARASGIEVWRLHGVAVRDRPNADRSKIANGGFEHGGAGWDIRKLRLDQSGGADRVRIDTGLHQGNRVLSARVEPGGRVHIGQVLAAGDGRLSARVRATGDVVAYLELRSFTLTGGHLGTRRLAIRGACACEPAAPAGDGTWTNMTFDLPQRLVRGAPRPAELIEIRFVALACDRCGGGELEVDDVELHAT